METRPIDATPALSFADRYEIKPVHYGVLERLFRVCVFQKAMTMYGILERIVLYIARAIGKWIYTGPIVDHKRLQVAMDHLKQMGAEEHFIIPRDAKARIHMAIFRAEALEERLKSFGASWEKRSGAIAIFPPKNETEAWTSFVDQCLLSKMGWYWGEVDGVKAIITCKDAERVTDDRHCFFHVHSPSVSFPGDRERLGFYLGMKQDVCFFDRRGEGQSVGNPSEKGYYLDAEAAFSKLLKETGYPLDRIWVTGTCGGGPIAAHIKAKYHEKGINCIQEQSFVDLRKEMIDPQCFLPRWLGHSALSGLEARDISPLVGPKEDAFSTETKWKRLKASLRGKVVIIHSNNDKTLSKGVEKRFEKCARTVNSDVRTLYFDSNLSDGHDDLALRYESIRRGEIEAIFH